MTKILMVCLGNICRSPLAEGLLRFKTDSTKVQVASAGTGDYHVGEPACEFSIKIASENLLDISNHRARQFTKNDFSTYDIIYVMDENNYKNVIALASNETDKNKVKYILNEVFPGDDMSVPDPYKNSYFAFKNIYKMLDEACEIIANKYK